MADMEGGDGAAAAAGDHEVVDMDLEDQDAVDEELAAMMAMHEFHLYCLEEMDFELQKCECHGFELRRVCSAVGTQVYSDFGLRLCTMFQDNLNVWGVYFVAAWACPMFAMFSPVFLHRPVEGVMGMIIQVSPVPESCMFHFLMAVGQMGAIGSLPCHYLRKLEINESRTKARFSSASWFGECVTALFYWCRDERMNAEEDD